MESSLATEPNGTGKKAYRTVPLLKRSFFLPYRTVPYRQGSAAVIGRAQVHEVQVQILCTQEMDLVLGFCRVLARSTVLSTDTEYKCT